MPNPVTPTSPTVKLNTLPGLASMETSKIAVPRIDVAVTCCVVHMEQLPTMTQPESVSIGCRNTSTMLYPIDTGVGDGMTFCTTGTIGMLENGAWVNCEATHQQERKKKKDAKTVKTRETHSTKTLRHKQLIHCECRCDSRPSTVACCEPPWNRQHPEQTGSRLHSNTPRSLLPIIVWRQHK